MSTFFCLFADRAFESLSSGAGKLILGGFFLLPEDLRRPGSGNSINPEEGRRKLPLKIGIKNRFPITDTERREEF